MVIENKKTQESFVMGTEGSGTIEFLGEGVDQNLKGKKCIFTCDAWA